MVSDRRLLLLLCRRLGGHTDPPPAARSIPVDTTHTRRLAYPSRQDLNRAPPSC
jgi:hypothetical protein